MVEILSDSEEERNPRRRTPKEVKEEAVSPGIRAMEDLYKRIRRDTLGHLAERDQSSSESGTDPIQPIHLASTQVLENNRDLLLLSCNQERKRSSSRDSDETLILTRRIRESPETRSPTPVVSYTALSKCRCRMANIHMKTITGKRIVRHSMESFGFGKHSLSFMIFQPIPVVAVSTERPPAAEERKTRSNSPLKDPRKPPAKTAQPKTPVSRLCLGEPSVKRVPLKKSSPKKPVGRSETKRLSPLKTSARQLNLKETYAKQHCALRSDPKQCNSKEESGKPIPRPLLAKVPANNANPSKPFGLESLEPMTAAVSHEPFDFNVQLKQRIKTAVHKNNNKPPTAKKPALKRLAKSPLKRKQPARTSPAKKKTTIKTAEEIKTEPEPLPRSNIILKSENAETDTIDVDDQIVSPLMSDGLWDTFEVISKRCSTNYTLVKSIIGMVEKGFTLPFICRYRRDQSGGLSPETIQSIREEYLTLIEVRKKAKALVTKLENEGNKDEDLKQAILSSRTLEELNVVMEPLKQKGRKTYAARARSIGLEELAVPIWRGEKVLRDFNLANFIDKSIPGRENMLELLQSTRYILADELRKSRSVLDRMEEISRNETELYVKQKKTKTQSVIPGKESSDNFSDYFEFVRKASSIESHQVSFMDCRSLSENEKLT